MEEINLRDILYMCTSAQHKPPSGYAQYMFFFLFARDAPSLLYLCTLRMGSLCVTLSFIFRPPQRQRARVYIYIYTI